MPRRSNYLNGLSLEELMAEQERRAMALDPVVFARRLGFKPDPWQVRLLRSKTQFRLLNCSRQIGKSETTSISVLHLALFEPGSLILLISPSDRQSGEIFRKVLHWLNVFMPKRSLPEENKTTLELSNGSRIVSLPSQESTIRSFSGVRRIVADEASRVPDPLYHAVRPMLMVNHGDFWGLSSPFGKRGWFYNEWANLGEDGHASDVDNGWERYEVPVTHVPRLMHDPEVRKFLAKERASKGERWFNQEYMCRFVELEDGVFTDKLVDAAFDPKVTPIFDGEVTPAEVDTGIATLDFGELEAEVT